MRSYDPTTLAYLENRTDVIVRQLIWISGKNRTTGATESLGLWNDEENAAIVIGGTSRNYYGAGTLLGVEPITAAIGLAVRIHEVQLSPLAPEVELAIRGYDPRLAPAEVHRALLSLTTREIIAAPVRMLRGWVDELSLVLGADAEELVCRVRIASTARALTRTPGVTKSDASQKQRDGDRFRRYGSISGATNVSWGEEAQGMSVQSIAIRPRRRAAMTGRAGSCATSRSVARADFKPGEHDCALFVAGGIAAMTESDPGAAWRGKYSTIRGGLKAVKEAGFEDHVALVASLYPEIARSFAQVGDLAVLDAGDEGFAALGLVQGEFVYVLRPTGLGAGADQPCAPGVPGMRRLALALGVLLASAAPAAADPISAAIAIYTAVSTFAAASAFNAFLVNMLITVAMTMLSRILMQPQDMKPPGIRTEATTTGEDTCQTLIFGTYGTAGNAVCPPMTWGKVGKTPNAYLVYVIDVCDRPATSLKKLFVNGEEVDITAAADAETFIPFGGRFATGLIDYGRVRFFTGNQNSASPYLLEHFSDYPERPWSTDMVGEGVAYVVLEFRFNREVYTGFPSVILEVEGIKFYDPRKDSTVGGSGAHRWGTLSHARAVREPGGADLQHPARDRDARRDDLRRRDPRRGPAARQLVRGDERMRRRGDAVHRRHAGAAVPHQLRGQGRPRQSRRRRAGRCDRGALEGLLGADLRARRGVQDPRRRPRGAGAFHHRRRYRGQRGARVQPVPRAGRDL